MKTNRFDIEPQDNGYFGRFGGQQIPAQLRPVFDELAQFYNRVKDSEAFKSELDYCRRHYAGRPSPLYHARKLSAAAGGAAIFLKREDLNHTGAHKINHCLGEALLARMMGKNKIIAETGAGQHGVALATAAALFGLECEIFMGRIDAEKQRINVSKMELLGARVIRVDSGGAALKDAVDAALKAFMLDPQNIFYAIGSVVGPHPFPTIVRDFQRVVGQEARLQIQEQSGSLPHSVIACVGGGSNAMGLFSAFLEDECVQIIAVEAAGRGLTPGSHAATLSLGKPGCIHGMQTYVLQDGNGDPLPVHSIASGLDYPGVGPQLSFLLEAGRLECRSVTDEEALQAFHDLSRLEGIIPALESAHAVAYACRHSASLGKDKTILVNLSGRGDKDVEYVTDTFNRSSESVDLTR